MKRKYHLRVGMWADGVIFPRIVSCAGRGSLHAGRLLDSYREYHPGYYVTNSVESVGKLNAGANSVGAEVFNRVNFEDVMIRENDQITGIVINWGPVAEKHLQVDPLMISTKLVIDGTGYDAAVCNTILRKIPNSKIGKLGMLGRNSCGQRLASALLLMQLRRSTRVRLLREWPRMQQPALQKWGLSLKGCSFQVKSL